MTLPALGLGTTFVTPIMFLAGRSRLPVSPSSAAPLSLPGFNRLMTWLKLRPRLTLPRVAPLPLQVPARRL